MFELSNEQRKCFGLTPVEAHWTRIKLKPSPYDQFETYAYVDGATIRKYILSGERCCCEHECHEQLSEDMQYLLPKTERGKPIKLSSSTLLKRKKRGVSLYFERREIYIYHEDCGSYFYVSPLDSTYMDTTDEFAEWASRWCAETTAEDFEAADQFARSEKRHVKYREGDVFRFRINRRLWGYGRILLDYGQMRKRGEAFFDVFCGQALLVSVYGVATEDQNLSVDSLRGQWSFPSFVMTDNYLYYGTCEIIGNIPVTGDEDYPIQYGRKWNSDTPRVMLGMGRLYREAKGESLTYEGEALNNHAQGSTCTGIDFDLDTLRACQAADSLEPYWAKRESYLEVDLRAPKYRALREQLSKQFGVRIPVKDWDSQIGR